MKILLLALLIAAPAWAQNAGGKGYDHERQAAFDRAQGIRKIELEIRRLLAGDALKRAINVWVVRSNQQGHEDRVGKRVWLRIRQELVDEMGALRWLTPETLPGRTCLPGSRVGASSTGRRNQPICFDPPVLAEHYFNENLRRGWIAPADRLMATAIHEIAHNRGEPESDDMLELTYLVEKTAAMGWENSNLVFRGLQFVVDLRVGAAVYAELAGENCASGARLEGGRTIADGQRFRIPLGITWNVELERYEDERGRVPEVAGLPIWFDSRLPDGQSCHVQLKLYDSMGGAPDSPLTSVSYYVGGGHPVTLHFELKQ
jgi:hypothetical protein